MKELIEFTREFVYKQSAGETTGHDWWHVLRVTNLALEIGRQENANLEIVELSALLHDIDDWKLNETGEGKVLSWLQSNNVEVEIVDKVLDIIERVSFKGSGVETPANTIEGKVVQDADRLDAIGAIGIARTFAYGGSRGREIYNPDEAPEMHKSFEDYKKSTSHTINHFYEKLLLLKDRMNTKAGKQIAEERHKFMEGFLERFYDEWEGKR